MKCPSCNRDKTKVKLTLPYTEKDVQKVLRERTCPGCGHKFQTLEVPADGEDEG